MTDKELGIWMTENLELQGISNASGDERANSEGRPILLLNWCNQPFLEN